MNNNSARHNLTIKSNGGLLNVLHSEILITVPNHNQAKAFRGIWDTGASATVITQEVVDALGLKPVGITYVNTASETNVQTHQFIVDVYLKNDLRIADVVVTLGKLTPGFHCLIGMDIITLGDFSITNHNSVTCMSFRLPSSHEIDYVQNPNMGIKPAKNIPAGIPGSNRTRPKKKKKK